MDGEWISAARAYELVSAASPIRVGVTICSRAFDGMVAARAKRLIWGADVRDDAEIPSSFWWARGHAALDQNWTTGDFETWIDQKIHCRAYGVVFRRSDIQDMLPARERPAREVKRSEHGIFEPAARCLEELISTLKCDREKAENLVVTGCRTGLVASRCAKVWWRVTDRYGATEYEDAHVAVPDWFWEHCTNGPDSLLNWQSGRFAGKGVVDGDSYKVIISGVQFHVADIVELEAKFARESHSADRSEKIIPIDSTAEGTTGRRMSEKWRPWIAELVAYIHEKGIPEGVGSQGQEEVIKAIGNRLEETGEEPLSRSTVQPTVQAVLDRLRSAEK